MRINALYVIVKLVERCNLNCAYCYYYQPHNAEVFERATLLSDERLTHLIDYVETALRDAAIGRVVFGFHGGEPTLAKAARVRRFCHAARARLEALAEVGFVLQTNGVHLSADWLQLVQDEAMGVGISIDGEPAQHDRHRVDHHGRGSYDRVCATLDRLRPLHEARRIQLSALAVMGEEFTGLAFYRHMVDTLGLRQIKLLFPDRTREDPLPDDRLDALAESLCATFDHWLRHDSERVRVTLFDDAVRALLASRIRRRRPEDGVTIGFALLSDGRVRIQDDYMVATDWFAGQRTLSIADSRLTDYLDQPHLRALVAATVHAPAACAGCRFVDACAGGEVAHRYSRERGFGNRSVYCRTLYRLYTHIAARLDSGQALIAAGAAVEQMPA